MSDDIHFESDPFASSSTSLTPLTPVTGKPKDIFNTPPLLPNTVFYLAIIRPHTDTHTTIGPVKHFLHLEPEIMTIVSSSPTAITKMKALRSIRDVWGAVESNHDFDERGFNTFIVDGQKGVYTVLKVQRQISKPVFDALPSPVFTVTSHGPLVYEAKSRFGAPGNKGYVAGTRLVGSYVSRKAARRAAWDALGGMTEGVEGLRTSEMWEGSGRGGGMVMGMVAGVTWEIRVAYEDQVHKRAREDVDREGERDVAWRL